MIEIRKPGEGISLLLVFCCHVDLHRACFDDFVNESQSIEEFAPFSFASLSSSSRALVFCHLMTLYRRMAFKCFLFVHPGLLLFIWSKKEKAKRVEKQVENRI